MKRRDYKNTAENNIYHIYNRGNNKENIFLEEQDYRAFLYRLGMAIGLKIEELNQNEITRMPKSRIRISSYPINTFKIYSFCLMPNHFHILIEQCSNKQISELMHRVCTSFSMYMNKKYKRVGHIFQGNFKAVLSKTNPQLMWTSSYIHMNPVKDKIVAIPEQYKWSSYRFFTKKIDTPILDKSLINSIFETRENLIKQTIVLHKNMSRFDLDI